MTTTAALSVEVRIRMARTRTQAMVSSAASIHAERLLIAEDLSSIFTTVIRAPEETRAGTKADDYLNAAADSDLLVVLLSTESRQAVINEVKAALRGGAQVAGFRLEYPPFQMAGKSWDMTPEEKYIRSENIWVKGVKDINELRAEVMASLAEFLARATAKHRFDTWEQTYRIAVDWLRQPAPKRVGMVQRTSTLFLGHRASAQNERDFLNEVLAFMKRVRTNRSFQFAHVFDPEQTLNEALTLPESYKGRPDLRIRNYKTSRLHFSGLEGAGTLGPVLVVNDRVGFGSSVGRGGSYVNIIDDKRVADEIFSSICANPKGVDSQFLNDLDSIIPAT